MFGGMDSSMGVPGGSSQTFVFHSGGQDGSEGSAGSFMAFPFDLSGFGVGGFSGGGGAQSSHSTPSYAMPKGTRIVVQGLAKAPEHNGKTGRVIAWDESSARYQVD